MAVQNGSRDILFLSLCCCCCCCYNFTLRHSMEKEEKLMGRKINSFYSFHININKEKRGWGASERSSQKKRSEIYDPQPTYFACDRGLHLLQVFMYFWAQWKYFFAHFNFLFSSSTVCVCECVWEEEQQKLSVWMLRYLTALQLPTHRKTPFLSPHSHLTPPPLGCVYFLANVGKKKYEGNSSTLT